jgi:3-oxoacyl-[acyl-carrier protein] reductase
MLDKNIAYDLGTGGAKASLYDKEGTCQASTFAREGAAEVILADLNEEAARRVADTAWGDTSCRFTVIRTDVGNPDDIAKAFREMKMEFSRVDVLVNCAGICTTSSIDNQTVTQWDKVMAINLRGHFSAAGKR